METTNEDRARNALLNLLDIAEHQYISIGNLADALLGGFLSGGAARYIIAERCEETAKLIGEKL
jgi:hypothetical protein